MKHACLLPLMALALIASACSGSSAEPPSAAPLAASAVPTIVAGIDPFAPPAGDLLRVDQQGAVTVEVTPLDLSEAADRLDFEVALNTHSVDLGMDLAPLATLSTDTGITVPAILWDAPRGGHHVRGTLSFAVKQGGRSMLAGATRLTLTISDLDGARRVFEWDLK